MTPTRQSDEAARRSARVTRARSARAGGASDARVMSVSHDVDDDDAGALARVRRARDEVDETLDFLGLGTKRSTRASEMDVDDDVVGRGEKRARGTSEVMDAMGRLSLAFEVGSSGGRRTPTKPTTRASTTRRTTLDLGGDAMRALDGANEMAESFVEDAERGRSLELEVRRPRDETAWLLGRALRGVAGGTSSAARLTSLTLRGGKGLSGDGFTRLVSALTEARALRKVDLSSCGLGTSAGTALAAVLDENGCPLERLDLRGNALGAEGAIAMAGALKHSKMLKALNLAHNLIGADGVRALAEALAGDTSVRELDIQHNGCGDEGCAALETHGFGNIERIFLGFNGIGADGARSLAEALRKRRREDGDDDMEQDDDGVARISKCMRRLDMKCNVLGAEGAQAIADVLHNVEELDLSNNSVRQGAKWLAQALKRDAGNLRELNLQANEMTDDDAWWLADALGENKSLKTLNLGSNTFGDPGATDIAADLRDNTTLETLDLTRNAIGRDGATELMNALDENSTLSRLGLESNLIPAETTMELKRRVGLRAQCDWQRAGFSDATASNAPMKFTG